MYLNNFFTFFYVNEKNSKKIKNNSILSSQYYLKNKNLFEVNLKGANITGAIFEEANLSGATWIDGRTCALGSVGACN